jgi:hypothetical protein
MTWKIFGFASFFQMVYGVRCGLAAHVRYKDPNIDV